MNARSTCLTTALMVCFTLLCSSAKAQDIPNVSVVSDGQSLSSILKQLGKDHNLNYVVSQAALDKAGKVECRLQKVPLDRAVQMLCAACHLEAAVQGRFVVIRAAKAGRSPAFSFPTDVTELPRQNSKKGTQAKANQPSKRSKKSGLFPEEPEGGGKYLNPEGLSKRSQPGTKVEPGNDAKGTVDVAEKDSVAPRRQPQQSFIGNVTQKDKNALIVTSKDGDKMVFYCPRSNRNMSFLAQIDAAFKRLQVGYRVVLTYSRDSKGRNWMESVIGGRDPSWRPPAKKTSSPKAGN